MRPTPASPHGAELARADSRRPYRRARVLLAGLAVAMVASVVGVVHTAAPAAAAGTLLSQGKVATASSTENAGVPASAAVDGDTTTTRWSSTFADPQWLQVDLGASATISQVTLTWEAAYGKSFEIQTSADASTWTSIYSTTTGTGGVQNLTVSGTGRYVRMYGTARGTTYGYSLWEFQVYGTTGTTGGTCGTTNAALGHPATASSTEDGSAASAAGNAVDGNTTTRWSSTFADPQWLQVDLGSSQSICGVSLNWEAAYGKSFQIQTSADGTTWTSIYSTTTGTGGVQNLTVSGTGRYVRMYGTVRATTYGYSLYEFSVFTTGGGTTTPPTTGACPTQSDNPNFGSNVHIFDPSMSSATIQAQLDADFNAQKDTNTAQFASGRVAELFKPGTYSVADNVGFYTSVAGLGQNPDDVTINGDVTVDAFNSSDAGNATQNFWRSVENLAINPSSGTDRWAVAQAAPFRRIDVHGNLNLYPASYGWASGGYIADTKVSGQVASASQQQWYSRDSNFGSWSGSNWNMVFSGVNGAPAQSFPNPPMTTLATTPVSRDVPYLYLDSTGKYRVFLPSLRTNASGPSWANGSTPGTSLPMSQFYVVKSGDTATTINQALSNGCNLFFTPGVYHVSQTLNVTKANTVVLGIGMPTIIPDNGVNAMSVADVDGVRLKGLLFDAGTTNSNALLTVGAAGSSASHAANPTTIQDVFFRIGGAGAGKATNSLIVNSNDSIIDHIWAWRADHGAGVGWTTNTADNGLTVNGNNVLATGLFVEHYQKYEVQWNGQNGKTIFFQNEMPYDVPNQAAWMSTPTTNGYAAYKVADTVTTHEAWGVGSYCYFNVNTSVNAYHAFEVPNTAGVKLHDLLTVSLGGNGTITHVINDTGATAQGSATVPVDVVSYP
ncbi:discoidin domain-containing protein [Jatrophihabitans sp. DSM 44399]|uniref:Discoidin domain-containing protein n=2 Tax=Jatrophihabitans lederbergiae TaxID=3075547 RepID=A0ABU2J8R3_9ACTN|nr:discoidin domain-containing protein [Jatrophihabitans sp. DSM 44399]MDT0260663.1 discoidin domain-containing protein [Jatrophihabitans sp. DSM 44399]